MTVHHLVLLDLDAGLSEAQAAEMFGKIAGYGRIRSMSMRRG